ncbi:hypothetical protein EYC98_09760 [Halieaceae bacterium IMCC14734]|uniref:Uncharacterized protein n=1 Tax=Candidatus Litorirhabdus singularis TaxID=2518993 RepID=A0ABT3TIC7_9GAMM|nr:hypothetical protein [Candidatus Litorirhabdus singularis]MCX2981149.1 hypothetical protein [Candidatus Litorirhabdus singularis]
MANKPCVFIHVNHKQILGAHVGERALRHFSANNDKFDVRFIDTRDHPFLEAREGQEFLRNGVMREWLIDDLQSFTPLRFMPPKLMGFEGRALIIDPDVFAVSDVWELLNRDMGGKAILCRPRSRISNDTNGPMASSVMLLDCAKLRHWDAETQFNEMFESKRDYKKWITLEYEARDTIGLLEKNWNDLDVLNQQTKMLHTTKRWTQPWKAGLPIDFVPADKSKWFPPLGWIMHLRRKLFGDYALLGKYKSHPDSNQENLFFGLLQECLEKGEVSEAMVKHEMAQNHVRHDAFSVLSSVPPLRQTLSALPA